MVGDKDYLKPRTSIKANDYIRRHLSPREDFFDYKRELPFALKTLYDYHLRVQNLKDDLRDEASVGFAVSDLESDDEAAEVSLKK